MKRKSAAKIPQKLARLDSRISRYEHQLDEMQEQRKKLALRTGFCPEFHTLYNSNQKIQEAFNLPDCNPENFSPQDRARLGNQCQLLSDLSKALHIDMGEVDEWGEPIDDFEDRPTANDILLFLWECAPLEALKEIVEYREKEHSNE